MTVYHVRMDTTTVQALRALTRDLNAKNQTDLFWGDLLRLGAKHVLEMRRADLAEALKQQVA